MSSPTMQQDHVNPLRGAAHAIERRVREWPFPIDAFLRDLERAGLSPSSREAYAYDLTKLAGSLGGCSELLRATEVRLREHFWAMHQRGVRAAAVRRSTHVTRRFYSWACQQALRRDDPATAIRPPEQSLVVPKALGPVRTHQLLPASLLSAEDREKLRDSALLWLSVATGVKLAELLSVDMADVDLANATLTVTNRGRSRTLSLQSEAVNALRCYLETGRPLYLKPGLKQTRVFLSRLGRPISPSGLWRHLQTLGAKAGLPPKAVSISALRQTFIAAHALESDQPGQPALHTLLGQARSYQRTGC